MFYIGYFFHSVYNNEEYHNRFNMMVEADSIEDATDMFEESLMISVDKSLVNIKEIYLSSIIEVPDRIPSPIMFCHEKIFARADRKNVIVRDNRDDSQNGIRVFIKTDSSATEPFVVRI